ncbi:TRAP transporter small permease [Salipiger thiooxidans]|uniref:TRAP transporter small permease n=1 Tax=Salipiger thiooxidans TaxID=282683 RepID=UPI001CD41C6B|nr:TRAP transporter small permease subunit [Salipiger thiooxidans]MCA0851190.1 TRAP transporter small permease subunit [Salipiger thiooxidans]
MTGWFQGTGEIFSTIAAGDSWMLSEAPGQPAVWPLGLIGLMAGASLVLMLYKLIPVLDRHFEATVMVISYLAIGGIICVEVFRRFVLQQQAPWSTTLPPFLFLIMTSFGCSHNVKLRTHLAFAELRNALPRAGQMGCLILDAALWFGFCWVVVVTSTRVAVNSASNFQIMLGTDNVMQWWFLVSVPLAFTLLAARALENLLEDFHAYRSEATLIEPAVIGGE